MKSRLTAIETLPEEVLPHCQWLYDAIKSQRMAQVEMLEEFNRRLQQSNHAKMSMSGLNRYVLKVRAGNVRRPEAIASGAKAISAEVFTASFREKIIKNQGVAVVTLLEASLSALASGKVGG